MLELTALQDLYVTLTEDASAAVDNDEARLLRDAAVVVSNMISIRLDRGETGYDGWSSTDMGGMYVNGNVSIAYRQIIINSPLGHIGTGRYELQLGSGTILKTDDTRMLAAALDNYLHTDPDAAAMAVEVRESIRNKYFPGK